MSDLSHRLSVLCPRCYRETIVIGTYINKFPGTVSDQFTFGTEVQYPKQITCSCGYVIDIDGRY